MFENVVGIVSAVKGGLGNAREFCECRIWVEFGAGEEVKITFCQFSLIFFKIFSISSFVLGSQGPTKCGSMRAALVGTEGIL